MNISETVAPRRTRLPLCVKRGGRAALAMLAAVAILAAAPRSATAQNSGAPTTGVQNPVAPNSVAPSPVAPNPVAPDTVAPKAVPGDPVAQHPLTQDTVLTDTVKVSVGGRGDWDAAAAELGQRAGLFRKRGIALELRYTEGSAETLQAVTSGEVDVGIGIDTIAVMAAFAKGVPLRAIGNAGAGSGEYWYVAADSPIMGIADAGGSSIAYSAAGSPSHLLVRALIKSNGLFARAVATGNPAATLAEVTSREVDVGWASPPFGLDLIGDGKIRIIARGNDLPAYRDQTARLIVGTAAFVERRKDVAARFVQGYRDALDWMYSDAAALAAYAEWANTTPDHAREIRDVFYPRDHLTVDYVKGLDTTMIDGLALRTIATPLTVEQLDRLFQIPPPIK